MNGPEKDFVIQGCFVHSTVDQNMVVLEDMVLGVRAGKIVFFAPKDELTEMLVSFEMSKENLTELKGNQFVMPGLVDSHAHAPQYTFTGSGGDLPLLPWLQKYTFPTETYVDSDEAFARNLYEKCVDRTLKNGSTTVSYYGTINPNANRILADVIESRGQRAFIGKVNMDSNSPADYSETTEESITATHRFVEDILARKNPLLTPCITPRFAGSCTHEVMVGLANIARQFSLPIQTHISENREEVKMIARMFPEAKNYTDVYDRAGVLGEETILAHGVYLSDEELEVIRQRGSGISHCPNSNFSLKSGVLDIRKVLKAGVKLGLGTDFAGGHSPSMFDAIRRGVAAANVIAFSQEPYDDTESPVTHKDIFRLATLGSARVMGLSDIIGNFEVGKQFDALLVDPDVDKSPFDVFATDSREDVIQKFLFVELHTMFKALIVTALLVFVAQIHDGFTQTQETPAEFLSRYETEFLPLVRNSSLAAWDKETDITEEHTTAYVNVSLELAAVSQQMAREALTFLQADTPGLTADQTRQLTKVAKIGRNAQTDQTKLRRLKTVTAEMEEIYSTAQVCIKSEDECLNLEPGLAELMRSSRDCEKLSDAWEGWRQQSGKRVKQLYTEYVQLSNDAVKILGHKDLGDYWRSKYDSATFEKDIAQIFYQIVPLYEQLHSFVRRKLKVEYGDHVFPSTGHIPGHLLGNMWAQSWNNIADLVNPFKHKQVMDVTEEMRKQGYTVKRMFETAEEFFYSLGFENMTEIFWSKSMLERPEGKEVVCHASAWDMSVPRDFRIKMCTTVNHEDLMTIHHEMGHIQYYMQYEGQPFVYRSGANPGFHEAVGDTIALSVGTPKHLRAIGLLKSVEEQDKESDLNYLMLMALDKIAFLPFSYLIDQWRWSVFRNDTLPQSYNQEWWNLRCRLQGISPPVKRDKDDFDPAAKYHIVADVAYIRYFVSFIIQFQFYKAACDAAGHTGPLYKCDFYNNKVAGEKLKSMLQLGSSQPWPEAMEKITGQRRMDAGPLMEYFQPLMDFLKKENGEDYGWEAKCPQNPPSCKDGSQRLYIYTWMSVLLALFCIGLNRMSR